MSWPDHRLLRWAPTMMVPSDDGTRLAVEVLGDGHPGPSIVFVHGWTLSSRSWHYQRMLAERHRLVLMDHRGHGESEPGPRAHRTVAQLGHDLHAVLAAAGGGRDVILVGHSMGGMTIMSLAASHPEVFGTTVKGVALLDTSAARQPDDTLGLPRPVARVASKLWAATLAMMSEDPARAERTRRSGSRVSVALSRWLNFGTGADRRLSRFTEALSAATPAEVVGDFWKSLDAHDLLRALPVIGRVPTLVLVGERDRLTPPAHSRIIAGSVPGARLVELRGAGHSAMLEQPEQVNAALRDLIASACAAPAGAAAGPAVREVAS
jgi:pimeloyl-ACP methyl ester carboxylesterase